MLATIIKKLKIEGKKEEERRRRTTRTRTEEFIRTIYMKSASKSPPADPDLPFFSRMKWINHTREEEKGPREFIKKKKKREKSVLITNYTIITPLSILSTALKFQ